MVYADVSDADVTCGEGRQMVFVDPAALFDLPLLVAATMQLPDLLDSPAYRDRFGGRAVAAVRQRRDWWRRRARVLMQERDDNPILDPGRWGLPGGHLDDGETFLAGARARAGRGDRREGGPGSR